MSDLFAEGAADMLDVAQELLLDIDREVPGTATVTADCRPALDVVETASSVEVVVDVAGVPAQCLRVILRRSSVLVVGSRPPSSPDAKGRFHLAERSYGRFARAVRVSGVFDGSRARAWLQSGQLHVVLPLIQDRRGGIVPIPVERA